MKNKVTLNPLEGVSYTEVSPRQTKAEWISSVATDSKNALYKGASNTSNLFEASLHGSIDEDMGAGGTYYSQSSNRFSRFPSIRDTGLTAASRERFAKQIAFIKIHYNYDKYNKMSEDAVTRRAILVDLIENYPEIDDLDYGQIMTMDLLELHERMERRKIECRMEKAAIIL